MNMAKTSSLVSYPSSSEESEDNDEEVELARKRKSSEINSRQYTHEIQSQPKRSRTILPLPDRIRQMGSGDRSSIRDDPSEHSGRIRSFPHEEGNWATLVYLPYEPDDEFYHLQKELFLCLRPLEFQPMADYHVSLSRTVTIRHHWIQQLVDSLRKDFAKTESCGVEIEGVKVYTNDEKTRSFLALNVTSGSDVLQQYVSIVDQCFKDYKLPEYYQPPSFHISIGWCLGDVSTQIEQKTKMKLKDILERCLKEEPELQFFFVNTVHCRTGNKEFHFPLTDT